MNALNYLEQSLLSGECCELWHWDIGKSPGEKSLIYEVIKVLEAKITMRAKDFYLLNGVTLNILHVNDIFCLILVQVMSDVASSSML